MATQRCALQSRTRRAGASALLCALLALGLGATHAVAGELRTRLAASDGGRTIFAVRCPSGRSTQVIVQPDGESEPQLCYRHRGKRTCASNLTVAQGAAKACGVPADDGAGDSGGHD